MSKLFKSHAPKPAGPATGAAKVPRGKAAADPDPPRAAGKTEEIGGPEGPEPTRYGDWEIKGRCVDF